LGVLFGLFRPGVLALGLPLNGGAEHPDEPREFLRVQAVQQAVRHEAKQREHAQGVFH